MFQNYYKNLFLLSSYSVGGFQHSTTAYYKKTRLFADPEKYTDGWMKFLFVEILRNRIETCFWKVIC